MKSVAWSPLGHGVGQPFSPDFFFMGLSFLTGLSFYWSYMVGHRFGFFLLWCDVTSTRFPEVRPHRRPCPTQAPLVPPGIEGICPSWLHGADGWDCSLLYAVHQVLSLGPCTGAVHGAPGHNRWGVVETPLPVKTQGGTMNCYFNLFNFPHQVLLSVWVLSVEQGPTVISVVTGPSSWKGALR